MSNFTYANGRAKALEKNLLTVYEKKNDVLNHTITSTWQFSNEITLQSYKISRQRQIFSLPEKLLPKPEKKDYSGKGGKD